MTPPDDNQSTIAERANRIWRAHHEAIRGHLARTGACSPDHPDVDEALQATAETLLQQLAAGAEIRDIRAWLIFVASQRLTTLRATQDALSQRELWRHDTGEVDRTEPQDLAERVAQTISAENLDRLYSRALGRLTPHQRGVLLAFQDGRSYAEIAAMRGLSVRSVDKALQKARRKLEADEELRAALQHWAE